MILTPENSLDAARKFIQAEEYDSAKNILDTTINTATDPEILLEAHYLRGNMFFHEAEWFHALNDCKKTYILYMREEKHEPKFELGLLKMISNSILNIVEGFNQKSKPMGGDSFLELEEEWILKLLDIEDKDYDIKNLLDRYVSEKISSTPLVLKYKDNLDRYQRFINVLEILSTKYSGMFKDLLIDLIMTLKYEDKEYKTAKEYANKLIKLKPKGKILRDALDIVKKVDQQGFVESRL